MRDAEIILSRRVVLVLPRRVEVLLCGRASLVRPMWTIERNGPPPKYAVLSISCNHHHASENHVPSSFPSSEFSSKTVDLGVILTSGPVSPMFVTAKKCRALYNLVFL